MLLVYVTKVINQLAKDAIKVWQFLLYMTTQVGVF